LPINLARHNFSDAAMTAEKTMIADFLQQPQTPLFVSRQFMATFGTQLAVTGPGQLPKNSAVLIVSNHRSFMDAALLMTALNLPIHFACHRYMGQVPVMKDVVDRLGFLPLDEPQQSYKTFFDRASLLLQNQAAIGIFPEGTMPMVQDTDPRSIGKFQRGFAHLALRAPVENLVVLPVAIAAHRELKASLFPVRWLQMLDPLEPLFDRPDWHPMVLYQQVQVAIGQPINVSMQEKQDYHGRQALQWVRELTEQCQQEIRSLLQTAL
jgi:1-acyl-sn-glycerol-3-phosphate acyltransferase